MIVLNKNINLYLFRSIAHYFQDIATTNSITFYLRDTYNKSSEDDEFLELNVGNLKLEQLSHGYFRIDVPVVVVYSVDVSSNTQRDKEIQGILVESFDQICIYEYDSSGQGSYIESALPGDIIINDFGQIEQLKQGSVESLYSIYLKQD